MNKPIQKQLTSENFCAWASKCQDGRYEFVDGEPWMIPEPTQRQNKIMKNVLAATDLFQRMNSFMATFGLDTFIRTPNDNFRRVDFGVMNLFPISKNMTSGADTENGLEAQCPIFAMMIVSQTRRCFDLIEKIEDLKKVKSLTHILLVDPDFPQVRFYNRSHGGQWTSQRVVGLKSSVIIPNIGIILTLSLLYEGVMFKANPIRISQRSLER